MATKYEHRSLSILDQYLNFFYQLNIFRKVEKITKSFKKIWARNLQYEDVPVGTPGLKGIFCNFIRKI